MHGAGSTRPLRQIAALFGIGLLSGAAAPAPKWEPIFDGKELSGWVPKITGHAVGEDPRHTFIVKDGAIHVSYDEYEAFNGEFGHLFWRTQLKSFRIRFEYRFTGQSITGIKPWQATNSGLMLLAQAPETMRKDQAFPVSLEMQLLGIPRPSEEPSGNLCTPGTTVVVDGNRDLPHCIASTSPLIPIGRWTEAEVEVLPSGQITHFIDGEPVLRYSGAQLDPEDDDARPLIATAGGALHLGRGYVALQSEGHPVEFRKIMLQRLE